MPGFAVVGDDNWVYRVHGEQRVQPVHGGLFMSLGGLGEDGGKFGPQQPQPTQVVRGYRGSEEWASRNEFTKRLATAQRVSISVTSARINQTHS